MGSDMAMEAANFRPRASYAEWDGDDLVVFKDYPISGYVEFWRYTNPPFNEPVVRSLLLTMVPSIPSKPVSQEARLRGMLAAFYDNRISPDDTVDRIKELFNGE